MPELPEVETIRRQLEKEVVGAKILDLWTDSPKQVEPTPERFLQELQGGEITKVSRRAKLLIFEVKKDTAKRYFVVHLKLTGRLLLREPDYPEDDYVHVILGLDKITTIEKTEDRRQKTDTRKQRTEDGKSKVVGQSVFSIPPSEIRPQSSVFSLQKARSAAKLQLRFADARKFGFIQFILNQKELDDLLSEFGPEPLDDLTYQKFSEILQKSSRKIKEVLMDQKTISGIGNIYANDALWLAGIHPERKASLLTPAESQSIFCAIEKILQEGLKTGGASDQWYRQIHGEEGQYQEHFKVYGRAGEPCLRHPEQEILYKKVGQRGTFWCPLCQKL